MAREDHWCMDDGEKGTCALCLSMGLKQEGWRQRKGPSCREELEKMVGLVEVHVMMCIAGDFNRHVGRAETGEEESLGGFEWGTRNREG